MEVRYPCSLGGQVGPIVGKSFQMAVCQTFLMNKDGENILLPTDLTTSFWSVLMFVEHGMAGGSG